MGNSEREATRADSAGSASEARRESFSSSPRDNGYRGNACGILFSLPNGRELLEAYVGDPAEKRKFYLERAERYATTGNAGWGWAPFCLGPLWLAWRRMLGIAFASFVPMFAVALADVSDALINGVGAGTICFFGYLGYSLYLNRAARTLIEIARRDDTLDRKLAMASEAGGTNGGNVLLLFFAFVGLVMLLQFAVLAYLRV